MAHNINTITFTGEPWHKLKPYLLTTRDLKPRWQGGKRRSLRVWAQSEEDAVESFLAKEDNAQKFSRTGTFARLISPLDQDDLFCWRKLGFNQADRDCICLAVSPDGEGLFAYAMPAGKVFLFLTTHGWPTDGSYISVKSVSLRALPKAWRWRVLAASERPLPSGACPEAEVREALVDCILSHFDGDCTLGL